MKTGENMDGDAYKYWTQELQHLNPILVTQVIEEQIQLDAEHRTWNVEKQKQQWHPLR